MTFQDGGNFDSSRVKRRSSGKAVAGGGIGLGVVAVVLLSQLFNVDLTQFASLLGSGTGNGTYEDSDLTGCDTADLANTDDECRYGWTIASLDAYWDTQLPEQTGVEYTQPGAVSFSDAVSTGCGSATSATGPFYCPADETVYIDVSFYEVLRSGLGASGGSLAQMYIVAHEVGHHIEHITGVLGDADNDKGAESDSVRVELMADCLAGMWAGNAATTVNPETRRPYLSPITSDQLTDALDAAAAVGDDRIQEAHSGSADPHTFTHGTSQQRQQWFMTGYEQGSFDACNTFTADQL